jgi:hypothetical protein
MPILILLSFFSSSLPYLSLNGAINNSGPPINSVRSLVKSGKGLILIIIKEGRSNEAIIILYYNSFT